jgi:CHAT domain-containing protein
MSLWKVPDEQTRELMIDFYDRVLNGQGVADALRDAQLTMKEKYRDPYFWGAFICQGNPGPLTSFKS